jgi:hypothetical protein
VEILFLFSLKRKRLQRKAGKWLTKNARAIRSTIFYFSIIGSETVNVVPFPYLVSNVIVPL